MFNSSMPSLADIAAVTNNDGIGGGNGWWVLIILFAIFGGWGNAGYGFGGGAGAADNYVLASDFSNISRQIDTLGSDLKGTMVSVANGISSLGYDQLSQMNGINTNIAAATNSLQTGITALGTQLQQCCCDNRQAIADLRYENATNTCAITNAINQAAQNIMQNDNANYRQLHDENVAAAMAAKDAQIADYQAQIQALNLAASQQAQNAYLISKLGNNCGCCASAC